MPTVRGIPGPYRFFFYSFDCREPKHVHVERDRRVCKFWLEPVVLDSSQGFRRHELTQIRQLIAGNILLILEAWEEHCG
ncbi:MAG: DUF4160 domain-containing protein [Gemmatimonadota bacterium]